jgi:DNA-binding CsgD family transcriptional regulator
MNILLNAGLGDPGLALTALGRAEPGPDVLASLIDVLAHGVILLGERGQLLHVNQAARLEFTRSRVLGRVGDALHATTPADGKTLQAALTKAEAGKRSLISLGGSSSGLMVAVVPLKPEPGAWKSRVLLLLSRADVGESGMFGFFARSHGLTQTEEQVLTILCRGLSTPEIARQMNVAVSTVRSHVRSLCAKTGSCGVRELVNQVAVLPPVAPCHLGQIH